MTYVLGFAPWLTYAAIAALTDWRWGAIAALVACAGSAFAQRRLGGPDLLSVSAVLYFVVLAAVAFLWPEAGFRVFVPVISLAVLAAVAWGSLAVRRPFTLTIARRSTPAQFWDTPLFLKTNTVITAAWATSFTVTAVLIAGVLAVDPSRAGLLAALAVAGFAIPALVYAALLREGASCGASRRRTLLMSEH